MCGICLTIRQRLRLAGRTVHRESNTDTYPITPCPFESTPLKVQSLHEGDGHTVRQSTSLAEACRRCQGCPHFVELLRNLGRRGPESFGTTQRVLQGTDCCTRLEAVSAVLGLRGPETIAQPYEIEIESDIADRDELNQSFLLWNGEIFGGSMCPPQWGSDTVLLASRLSALEVHCCASPGDLKQRQTCFISRCVEMLESEVEGPYGFLFYASQLGCVVFGRDPLGRHSLLVHLGVFPVPNREECEVEFILSSVGVQHGKEDSRQQKRERTTDEDEEEPEETAEEACWVELPVTGLYGLSLDDPLLQSVEAGENVLQRCGLLHCAWRGAYHLAHPLLMEEQTAPSLPIGSRGENTLSLANTAVESELPKLLLERIRQSSPVSSEGEDVWAHWAASRYLYALSNSVLRRCNVSNSGAEDGSKIEKVFQARRRPLCVLFSGGIDCTVLAALAHYLLPIETPIELINVAFGSEPEKAPDRIAAKRAMTELLQLPQPTTPEGEAQTAPPVREREWRLVFVDVPEKKNENTQHVLDIIYPCKTVMDFDIGTALWNAARGEGRMQVLRKSDLPVDATATTGVLGDFSKHIREGGSTEEKHAPAAPMGKKGKPEPPANFDKLIDVLVDEGRQSGGTAPVLLSTLGKEYAAFLKPCWQPLGYKKLGSYLNDAVKAGVIAFDPTAACKAVRLVRPEDLERAKPQPPLLWYETQQMQKDGSRTPLLYSHTYTSGAKVLLLGTGADETLGGYTRYRRFYQRHGMPGAREELERDFRRLWKRNLGRDDRITMDSGREPRFPYLDEEVLRSLRAIVQERREVLRQLGTVGEAQELQRQSMSLVVDFTLPPGVGDKRVLREAAVILGLQKVAKLQKRAIQFGSRIAERKQRGSAGLD